MIRSNVGARPSTTCSRMHIDTTLSTRAPDSGKRSARMAASSSVSDGA
ncbi:MAG: hypothetical protein J6P46_06145 [Bacteroidales bacterium]|nr:hypothetical protein [Bacteroidales bacterium]